jgi:hypothetical protein
MPTPRAAPTRSSQRRNSQQDDTPARTRASRGGRAGPSKSERPETVPPKSSPTKLSPTLTRKTTRSASNISGNSFENAPGGIYATYEQPLFIVWGIPTEFFHGLKKHHGKLPKERKVIINPQFLQYSTSPEPSETEEESDVESEVDVPIAQPAARGGRGRGGRGGRGGRARGGRGRGRGGRGRGGTGRTTSPARPRPSRNAAPVFPLIEEDEDQPSNQTTPNGYAKPPTRLYSDEPAPSPGDGHEFAIEDEDEDEDEFSDYSDDVRIVSRTPRGSPPAGLLESILDGTYVPTQEVQASIESRNVATTKLSIPKISLLPNSTSQTPLDSASTPAESAVPKLLDPEDDELSESDLPEPFIYDAPMPIEAECEDRADYLLQKRFKPLVDAQEVIATLTKFSAAQRSTESLYALAENTQKILKAWQDEYLLLDARVSFVMTDFILLLTIPDCTSYASAQKALQWWTYSCGT